MSKEQVEEKVEKEQKQLAAEENHAQPSAAQVPIDVPRIIKLEKEAIRRLELLFGENIERNVRIVIGSHHFELDGLIPSVVDDIKPETLIEVKYLRSPNSFPQFLRTFPRIEELARAYMKARNKIAKLHIVLIVEGEERLNDNQLSELKRLVDSSSVAAGYSVFSTKELSVEIKT